MVVGLMVVAREIVETSKAIQENNKQVR